MWPSRSIGLLDGVPLDTVREVLAIGVLFPVLCWLHPGFLNSRTARGLAVALLAIKVAAALLLTQQGWCERLVTQAPLSPGAHDVQLAWDARADWRHEIPECSAILARPYPDLLSFPAWFLNLAEQSGRPPHALVTMTVDGYMSTPASGELRIRVPEGQRLHGTIDEAPIDESSEARGLDAGVHHVRLWTVFQGDTWKFIPTWNGANLFSSVLTTTGAPNAPDRFLGRGVGVLVSLLVIALLLAWTVSAAAALAPGATAAAWVALASATMFIAGDATVGGGGAGRLAVAALIGAVLVPLPERLRDARGAFLLVGVPWLALAAGSALVDVGRFTLFTQGDDFTFFQRYAYRIYMQGYWLEGGQQTFWYQPLYRWIIGLVHLVFGDSSVGERFLDAAWLWIGAAFAFVVCRRVAGFRWALATTALLLATIAIGPSWWIVGRDLSEITAAGFAYSAALLLVSARRPGIWRAAAAGALGVLCFYTRLNHLPWMFALVVLLLPLDVPAAALWRPRAWLSTVRPGSIGAIIALLCAGLVCFAWRTWHYTGVFSVFYGTQRQLVATIQPTDSFRQAVAHLVESLLVLITVQDPPRFDPRAIPVAAGIAIAVLALIRVPWCREMPAGPALFCAAGLVGALVARGTGYVGRFSIHLMPSAVALVTCFAAAAVERIRRPAQVAPA